MKAFPPIIAIVSASILSLVCISSNAQMPSAGGPVDLSAQKIKIVANFEEGVDSPFSIASTNMAPHFWTAESPWYSYSKVSGPNNSINSAWGNQPDNINWWDVMAKNSGTSTNWQEYSDCDYSLVITKSQTYYPSTYDRGFNTNYQNWNGYDNLHIKLWLAHSEGAKPVNLQVYAYSAYGGGIWKSLGFIHEAGDQIKTVSFPLNVFTTEELKNMATVKFRVFNNYLTPGNSKSFQRNHLFSIKLQGTATDMACGYGPRVWSTRFLGSVSHKRYGSYSADGFFDEYTKTFKIWFGGGAQEGDCMDNVYYYESPTNSLSPGTDLTKAVRCTLADNGVLSRRNGAIFAWGDPAVVKFHGSTEDIYLMYFTGQNNLLTNKGSIYRAYSTNGKDFIMSPTTPVVDASSGGSGIYGSGAPSIIYLPSTQKYYMYYFSDNESAGVGCYLRTSTDSINWGSPTLVALNQPAMAVKYIESLGRWVGISEDGGPSPKLKTAISDDGIHWRVSGDNSVAGDPAMHSCHNPGFIGNSLGHGSAKMYYTFGASEQAISPSEYLTRQLEYGSWSFTLGPELLQDSFETPQLPAGGYEYAPRGTAWVFTGNAGVTANGSPFNDGKKNAPEFRQAAFIQGTGKIQQTVNLQTGIYAITFQIAQRDNIRLNSQRIRVLVDNVAVGDFSPGRTYQSDGTAWIWLAAGNHTFTFEGLETTDQTAFIDAIVLYRQ
jgi:hypothetical protein